MLMTSTRTCDMTIGYDTRPTLATVGLRGLLWVSLLLLGFPGCAPHSQSEIRYERIGYWQWQDIVGRQIATEHYLLYTTLSDEALIQRLCRVMESAHKQYAMLAPAIPPSDRKLPLYVFATYDQWSRYTVATTGNDANAYLSVLNGGYAVKDEFVCWVSNESDMLTTAAHEGLHQFVARHFQTRLPPTIEEGLAATFETYSVGREVITFDPATNIRRQSALREAISGKYLIPLETLLKIHAGDLRDRGPLLREAYYAQAWALASMLRRHPAYREPFITMMNAAATGNTTIEVGRNDGSQLYYVDRIKPFLQKYIAPDWQQFESAYQKAVHELATPADQTPTSH